MTRRFWSFLILPLAFLPAARNVSRADTTDALAKSAVLENNTVYLRVAEVGTNLAEEIQSAQVALSATNKIAGTILDLRFADGDDLDSVNATAGVFASEKLPLAVLVNGETRNGAVKLVELLQNAHEGLIFGSTTSGTKSWGPVQPDIAVTVKPDDEKMFFENPFGTLAQDETNSAASTNSFISFVDHTTEADLVREKIKDGDQAENSEPPHASEPQKTFIRDPVLARAVDLIKGLAIVRQTRL